MWFYFGLLIGFAVGFIVAGVLSSGKNYEEAKLAYQEGLRVGRSER